MKHTLVITTLLLGSAGIVEAESRPPCTEDDDCADGEFCAIACNLIGCPEDDPDCGCADEGICLEVYEANPNQCATDDDCGLGYVCDKTTQGTSSSCAEPPCGPATVETTTILACVPEPCSADADCDPGFECVATGGVCSVDSDGNATCTAPDPKERTCRPMAIVCESAGDCPPEWECAAPPATLICNIDPETGECEPQEPGPNQCTPPGYDGFAATMGVPRDDSAGPGGEEPNTDAAPDPDGPGAPRPTIATGAQSGGDGCSVDAPGSHSATLPVALLLLLGFARARRLALRRHQ